MRTKDISRWGMTGIMRYPDERVFAFNPNYVELEFSANAPSKISIVCNGVSFDIAVHNNKATANISRFLRIGFDDPRNERVKMIPVELRFQTANEVFYVQAIWGYTNVGDRLNSIGAYHYNESAKIFERHVRWFYNLPQKLSVYNGTTFELFTPTRTQYTYGVFDTTVENDLVWDETFDDTFKQQFEWTDNGPAIIVLHKDKSTRGYFLRWIDNFGHMQYYLFDKGTRNEKPEAKTTVGVDIVANGNHFGGGKQSNKKRNISVTCAAVNAMQEEFDYLATILTSPIVDMYVGKTQDGEELWVPVIIESKEYEYSERKEMQDFVITFELPTSSVQSL